MEAHVEPGFRHRPAPSREAVTGGVLIKAGVIGGVIAGMMMAMFEMILGAIAQEPTAAPGIDSTFWTAVTSIPSVLFGMQWFHGSFEFWAVFLGIMGHMMNSAIIGVIGISIATAIFRGPPSIPGAIVFGAIFGLVLEVVIVNLIVNNIQDVNTLYTAVPEWGWWVAHGIFGMTLGVVASLILRREAPPAPLPRT